MADTPAGTTVEVDGFVIESSSQMPGATTNADELRSRAKATLADIPADDLSPPDPEPAPKTDVTADPGDPATTDPPAPKSAGDKRLDSLQARIHAATRERHEIQSAINRERAELERIRAEREALADTPHATKADAGTKPAATDPPAADDPMPEWDGESGYDAQGKTFSQFQRDLASWMKRQTAAEVAADVDKRIADRLADLRKQQDEQGFEDAMDRRHVERVQKLKDSDPEFIKAIGSKEFQEMPRTPFMTALIKLHDKGDDVLRHVALHPAEGYAFADLELTGPMMDAFKSSDDPVALLSALANNIEEAERIARLSPAAQMRALVTLELQATGVKSGPSASAASTPAKPPLPARVGGSRSVAPQTDPYGMGTDDAAAYVREMNRREREANV